MTNEELEKELISLRRSVAEIKKTHSSRISAAKKSISDSNYRLSNIEKRVKLLDPQEVIERILASEDHVNSLARGYRVLHLKLIVLGEVEWLVRMQYPDYINVVSRTLMRMLDEPDDWWKEREELKMSDWVGVTMKCAARYAAGQSADEPYVNLYEAAIRSDPTGSVRKNAMDLCGV